MSRESSARDPAAETRRALARLRDLIEDADLPRRRIEALAGFGDGYLSQLLAGTIELKLGHVLAVLRAIEVPAWRFFAGLYPPRPGVAGSGRDRLRVPADHDIASVYAIGIESLEQMRRRLERCEDVLAELHQTGVLPAEDDLRS